MYYNVTGLTERTKYFINVIAVNEMGPGRQSETLEITTGKKTSLLNLCLLLVLPDFHHVTNWSVMEDFQSFKCYHSQKCTGCTLRGMAA